MLNKELMLLAEEDNSATVLVKVLNVRSSTVHLKIKTYGYWDTLVDEQIAPSREFSTKLTGLPLEISLYIEPLDLVVETMKGLEKTGVGLYTIRQKDCVLHVTIS